MTEAEIKKLERLQSERNAALAACKAPESTYIDLTRFEKCRFSFENAIISSARELIEAARLCLQYRNALMEVRTHLHAAGRRPETCHEMSVIDDALTASKRQP